MCDQGSHFGIALTITTCVELHPHFTSCRPHTLRLSSTHPVEEVGAAHSSNLADVVHETQVSLGGAVHLAHFNVSKTNVEFPPDVLTQPIPDSHPHLVNFIQLSLMEGEGCDDISRIDLTGDNFSMMCTCLQFKNVFYVNIYCH